MKNGFCSKTKESTKMRCNQPSYYKNAGTITKPRLLSGDVGELYNVTIKKEVANSAITSNRFCVVHLMNII
jgi:hypothetical protein